MTTHGLDDQERPAWARRDNEGGPPYEAFRAYLEQGPGKRSHTAVAEELGKSRAIVGRWSADHDWVERSQAWDSAHTAEALARLQRAIVHSTEKAAALYERMFGKALEGLDALAADGLTASDITRLSGEALRQSADAYALAERGEERERGRESSNALSERLRELLGDL